MPASRTAPCPANRRLAWFFGPVLRCADAVLAQTEVSAERYRELGARHVEAAGNLKYDFQPRQQVPAEIQQFLQRTAPEAIWIAASTMPPQTPEDPDEDDIVIETFLQLRLRFEKLLLILVPRRPERFDAAAAKLEAAGIPYARRSRLTGSETAGVLLLDSMGELSGLFSLADVVFMGGTFPHRGGHNILEPAFFAKPVVCGPHMENFRRLRRTSWPAAACWKCASLRSWRRPSSNSCVTPRRARARSANGLAC